MAGTEGDQDLSKGYACLVTSFGLWSLFPVYFKWVDHLPVYEVLSHRILWGFAFCVVVLLFSGRLSKLAPVFRSPKALFVCFASGALISLNWLTFIIAVGKGKILESSLGYFISPLLIVFLGAVFWRERLSKLQTVAVSLATIGVLYQVIGYGDVPIYALGLAFTFGFYSLLRKMAPLESMLSLTIETMFMSPLAGAYLVFLGGQDALVFGNTGWLDGVLLVGIGAVTALPLIFFGAGARIIPMKTIGILQYSAPTGHFILGVFVYNESFTMEKGIAFAFIWVAVAMYIFSLIRQMPRNSLAKRDQEQLKIDVPLNDNLAAEWGRDLKQNQDCATGPAYRHLPSRRS